MASARHAARESLRRRRVCCSTQGSSRQPGHRRPLPRTTAMQRRVVLYR
jgi:hypothetical protein